MRIQTFSIMLAALVALGIGSPQALAQAKKPASDKPAIGIDSKVSAGAKVFRYAFPIAETGFDPAQLSDLYSGTLIGQIFDTPYEYDFLARPSKIVPNVTTAMPEVSADGKEIKFTIKPGIYYYFDDAFDKAPKLFGPSIKVGEGANARVKRELVANDFVYSMKRHFDPVNKSPNLYLIDGFITGMAEHVAKTKSQPKFDYDSEIEGLKAVDKYTVQIKLTKPNYNFQHYLTYTNITGAVAREVVDHYGSKAIMEHPVGTGPYKLKYWKRASKIVLDKNPNYREEYYKATPNTDDEWGQQIAKQMNGKRIPNIDQAEVYIIEEPQPRWLAYLNDEMDFMERLPNEFANQALRGDKLAPNLLKRGMWLERTPGMELTYQYFQMENPIVGGYTPEKIALRRAISMGYNTANEVNIARKGQAIPAESPVGPGAAGYNLGFKNPANEYSIPKAKALLDMYGYVDKDGDGWRDMPDGSPLEIEYASRPGQEQQPLDENWQKSMNAINLKIKFKKANWPDLLKESRQAKLMMWGLGWSAAIPDADAFFVMLYGPNSGQANHGRFRLKEFDNLYEKAKLLPDGPERDKVYTEMKRLFAAYAPWKLGTHRIHSDIGRDYVVGYRRHPVMRQMWKFLDIDQQKFAAAMSK
jgi:ABC-type transport system substrate-binding protein